MTSEGHPQTERLYERLRADVARWTEGHSHDPGIAIAELFAYLADTLSAYQDKVGREAYLGPRRFIGVRLQEGRVVVDSDWDEAAGGKRYGLYRALVVDATDPLLRRRLRVQVPVVREAGSPWALPSLQPGSDRSPPTVGSIVWVLFEEGDVDRPVWVGMLPTTPAG